MIDISRKDTICALATAPTPSALAIVRASGSASHAICARIFKPLHGEQKPFVATHGHVIDPATGTIIDDAVCILFPEGKSFTGEASFEISLHGNPLLARQVLDVMCAYGCRLAQPGEFSMRAVLTGKIDLCAAEAIHDLIAAQSKEAAQSALRTLQGGLSNYLLNTRTQIIDSLCEIEARLDFPDEDLGATAVEALRANVQLGINALDHLLKGAQLGRKLHEGARVVLFGLPNAGKSTLLNRLLGEEKALVHHMPGTTRDVLEGVWVVGGVPVTLVDVAGLRNNEDIDTVEAMGIERALKELARADLVLWLCDGTNTQAQDDAAKHLEGIEQKIVRVFTKADQVPTSLRNQQGLWLSAHTGEGIDALSEIMTHELSAHAPAADMILLSRARQREEVLAALHALQQAHDALLARTAFEVVASELRQAGNALDRLLGKSLNEDVLDLIFSRFCIGK